MGKRTRQLVRYLGLIACALPCLGHGSETPASTDFTDLTLQQLMGLEVFTSATLIPTQAIKTPATVYRFDRKDFNRLGVRRLDDLMAFVPGVQVNQYRTHHRNIWSRGMLSSYNDKLVLMVDGVVVKQVYYGHFSLGDEIPLEQIESVEILQGPISSLYGANAFGGIISVTTRELSESPEAVATVEMGNFDRKKGTFLLNSERAQLFGSVLSQQAPFRDDRRSFTGGAVSQASEEDYRNLTVKGTPLEGLTLYSRFMESRTPHLFMPERERAFFDDRSLTFAARHEKGDLATGQLTTSISHRYDKASELEVNQDSGELAYIEYHHSESTQIQATGMRDVSEHTLAAGISASREKMVRTDFIRYFHPEQGWLTQPELGELATSNGDFTDLGLFLQDVWHINDDVEVTTGGRYDRFDQFGNHSNFRAAAVFTPTDRQSWKLMYGTAIRTPSVREFMQCGTGNTLEPEEIRSLELGFTRQWSNSELQLNAYRSGVDNYILERSTDGSLATSFVNLSDSWTLTGAETLLQISPSQKLNARFSLSYLEVRGSITNAVPYLANWNGSALIHYQFHSSHQLGASVTFTSKRPETNTFREDDAGGYAIANLFASGNLPHRLHYSVGIDNLFDKHVFDPAVDFGRRFNTENHGREIWVQLEWSFPN